MRMCEPQIFCADAHGDVTNLSASELKNKRSREWYASLTKEQKEDRNRKARDARRRRKDESQGLYINIRIYVYIQIKALRISWLIIIILLIKLFQVMCLKLRRQNFLLLLLRLEIFLLSPLEIPQEGNNGLVMMNYWTPLQQREQVMYILTCTCNEWFHNCNCL
jgi:hypothetical protein